MEIIVKEVEIGFLEDFHHCLNEVAKERVHLMLTSSPDIEKMKGFIEGNIRDKVPQVFAFDGEKMVGWCDIRPFGHATMKHRAEVGMGVIREYRGRGIGKLLLSKCLEIAKNRDIEIVYLHVFSDNKSAIGLYESMGFIQEGFLKKYRKIDGHYQDCVCMSLEL